MGVDIDPHTTVSQLSTGYRQLTEIASAVSQDARILILDEPTASLAHTETSSLFKLIRRLKGRGISIIYISHRMEEIFEIADRITVLRDGRRIITDEIARLNMQQVIEHIIGRKTVTDLGWQEHTVDRSGQPLLEVKELSNFSNLKNISFRLYPGEVLGLAGLMGSGRTEVLRALFGINQIKSGDVRVNGQRLTLNGPGKSMIVRIALIPEDRRLEGLNLSHSLRDNFLLPLLNLGRLKRRTGLVDDQKGNQLTAEYVQQLNIRVDSIYQPVSLLSGGNQQKVVLAKWLSTDANIFMMDEPTAGVDVGTKAEILEIVRELAKAGKGVIIISSEFKELLAVCDRILIIKRGEISQELDRRQIQTEEKLYQILQGAG